MQRWEGNAARFRDRNGVALLGRMWLADSILDDLSFAGQMPYVREA